MKFKALNLLLTTLFVGIVGISFSQTVDIWEVESECALLNGSGDILDVNSVVPLYVNNYGNEFSHSISDNIMKIDFENTQSPQNWESIDFRTINWTGGTGNYFVNDVFGNPQLHDIATGYVFDFSDSSNQYVSFDIQVDESLEIWMNLYDIVGRNSNGDSPKVIIPATVGGINVADETKWQHIVFAWNGDASANAWISTIVDSYSFTWNGVDNNRTTPAADLLDLKNICGVALMIDPSNTGLFGDNKTLYIRNFKIGTGAPIITQLLPFNPVNLNYENDSVSIDLLDYYTGTTASSFMAGTTSGNNTLVSIDGSVVSIKAKNKCTAYNNTVQVQLTDATKVYTRTFPVIFNIETIDQPEIGIVTVDTTGSKILLAWERPITNAIESYSIYREGLTDQYTKIGEVPYDSISVFVDSTALINTRAYKYKISYTNKCGVQSSYSTPHKSIHLQKTFTSNELHLNWTTYEGATVLGYRLVGGNDPNVMVSLDEFATDQTSYSISNPSYAIYRIETIMGNTISPAILKSESGPFILALSNLAEAKTDVQSISKKISVYPTITNDVIHIDYNSLQAIKISLISSSAEEVYTNTINKNTQIPVTQYAKGIYVLRVEFENEIFQKQIIIQ